MSTVKCDILDTKSLKTTCILSEHFDGEVINTNELHVNKIAGFDDMVHIQKNAFVQGSVYVHQGIVCDFVETKHLRIDHLAVNRLIENVNFLDDVHFEGGVCATRHCEFLSDIKVGKKIHTKDILASNIIGDVLIVKKFATIADLMVEKNVTVNGTLSAAHIDLPDTLNVNQLLVSDHLTAEESQLNLATIHTLTVDGDATMLGHVQVERLSFIEQEPKQPGFALTVPSLQVNGHVQIDGDMHIENLQVNNNISVSSQTVNDTLNANAISANTLVLESNLVCPQIKGLEILSLDTLNVIDAHVDKKLHVGDELVVVGSLIAQNNLDVIGNVVLQDDLLVDKSLFVNNMISCLNLHTQNALVDDMLIVENDVHVNNNLHVRGKIECEELHVDQLSTDGAVTLGDESLPTSDTRLNVFGNATISLLNHLPLRSSPTSYVGTYNLQQLSFEITSVLRLDPDVLHNRWHVYLTINITNFTIIPVGSLQSIPLNQYNWNTPLDLSIFNNQNLPLSGIAQQRSSSIFNVAAALLNSNQIIYRNNLSSNNIVVELYARMIVS